MPPTPSLPQCVASFTADVNLTPKLSVGTDAPESIYEARFKGRIEAVRPNGQTGDCELALPFPPQIISLADLSITAPDGPSESRPSATASSSGTARSPAEPHAARRHLRRRRQGPVRARRRLGRSLDKYHSRHRQWLRRAAARAFAAAHEPRARRPSTYRWDYERLLFGRPVRIDVLGIAPIDRLGELTWLGPLSVVVFGLLVGLVCRSSTSAEFDRWMLLLTIGTFAGGYPLMYFAQEYIPLLPP